MIPDKLIVALDVPNFKEAKKIVSKLGSAVTFYKVGLRLFAQEGPPIIKWLKSKNKKVFLDIKFHDIPNTVAQAVESAVKLGVDLLTIHALGGPEMMKAAVNSAHLTSIKLKKKPPQIFAVTILTSHHDLKPLGISYSISNEVLLLAKQAQISGVSGVVCSPHEIKTIRKKFKTLKILTPGIRLSGNSKDDQKRTASPNQALTAGADYLVIGRPVLQAREPKKVIMQIYNDAEIKPPLKIKRRNF